MIKYILIFFAFSIFSNDFEIIEDRSNIKILTRELKDQKRTKIKLKNGLLVYIISDPNTKESAASMSVRVGFWNDPEKYQGMAHFTEHMLFQGTERYPDRESFFNFIKDVSGETNAFTSSSATVFTFSCTNENFKEGLDRFSDFFISPLFAPSAIESELEAVDEEHKLRLENDYNRMFAILQETGNQKHPNHMFSCGNRETLSKIPLKELIKWHARFYNANNMILTIYSNETIENQIEEVVSLFKDVKSGKRDNLKVGPLFTKEQKGHMIYMKPIKDMKSLVIYFELPRKFLKNLKKPYATVSYALGAGDKNSLIETLKERKLARKGSSFFENFSDKNLLISLDIDLTELGVKKIDDVIATVFETINGLKKTSLKYLQDELLSMKLLNYQYQAPALPFTAVKYLSKDILFEDFQTFPRNSLLPSGYSEKSILEVLNLLTPQNATIVLIAPDLNWELTKKEKWFGAKYSLLKIDDERLRAWEKVAKKRTPKKNTFIPKNLEILEKVKKETIENSFCKMVLLPYETPTEKIDYTFTIRSPNLDDSIRSHVLKDIFLYIIKSNLDPLIKRSEFAGLYTYKLKEDIGMKISGYSQKANLLLKEILTELKNPALSEEKFELTKKRYEEELKNNSLISPADQAIGNFKEIIEKIPTIKQKLLLLEDISYRDFYKFTNTLFDRCYVEAFISGNVSSIKPVYKIFKETIFQKPFENFKKRDVLSIPNGPYKIEIPTKALGSATFLAVDENPFSFKRYAAKEILAISINEPFFSEIRSKQRSAYLVRSTLLEKKDHLFQTFFVQSSNVSPEELLYRFELFIDDYILNLKKNVTKDRFLKIKKNLIDILKIPSKNLFEFSNLQHFLIFEKEDLDFIKRRIDHISKLSYEEFLDISKELLSRENKKRLAILVKGKLLEDREYKKISKKDLNSLCRHKSL